MGKTNNLVIVESPSKAKTIGRYLGPGYTVKASMGHLRDLPKSKMGVDLEHNFTPQYIPVRGKEALIKELKADAAKADTVYLATDPDREGEAISWHLKELLNLTDGKAQRVTFNEITQKVVKDSIQHPRDIDYDLVDAQQARRILDRIVGYELSPLLWKKVRRGMSSGRVQSVATRMVVDRQPQKAGAGKRRADRWNHRGHYRAGIHRHRREEGGEEALLRPSLHHLHLAAGGLPEAGLYPQEDHDGGSAAL